MSNRDNRRGRHRNMYNLTGVPGWIRFGSNNEFSNGRDGRDGRGLGPCAEYISKTGQMDDFLKNLTKDMKDSGIDQQFTRSNSWNFQKNEKQILTSKINNLEEELKILKRKLKDIK